MDCLDSAHVREDSPFVFPADCGDGHFIGVVHVLHRLCVRANLDDVTPHTLRHTFASVAGDLGFSELTIAGILGHSARGVTQRYIHLDKALVVAADEVAAAIAQLLDGETAALQVRKTATAKDSRSLTDHTGRRVTFSAAR